MLSNCRGCMAICGTANKPKDPEKCAGYIPKTNGNVFRGASDEIIAEFIASNRTDCYRCAARDLCEDGMCKNAWHQWLQSMAEEGEA